MLFFRCDLRSSSTIGARWTPLACATLALLIGTAAAGCASNCATNCPNLEFDVLATPGENLNVLTATWTGAGCPLDAAPQCRGDLDGTNLCTRFSIETTQSGSCELDLTFSDGRLPFRGSTTFGPETHQGCCHGFPVIGAASVTVPPLYTPVGFDASPDGDASSDGDASD